VEGKKMSKSLGNFYTLRDLLAKGFAGREIRYLLLTAHYREQFNFTVEGLQGARTALGRLDDCTLRLKEIAEETVSPPDPSIVSKFSAALDDNLNISAAWGILFDWVRELNRFLSANRLAGEQAGAALATWQHLDSVLGLAIGRQKLSSVGGQKAGGMPQVVVVGGEQSDVPPEMAELLAQRQAARKAKEFKRADAIRDELKAKGWAIEDTPKGARLKRL
jgi:cysteinyl-tRNA synthetase